MLHCLRRIPEKLPGRLEEPCCRIARHPSSAGNVFMRFSSRVTERMMKAVSPFFLHVCWDGVCFISLSRRCSSCRDPGRSIHQSRVMIHFLKLFWVSLYVTSGMIDVMTRLVYEINLNFLCWNGICCCFPMTGLEIRK